MKRLAFAVAALAVALAAPVTPALADEGMWTFDNLPLQLMQERYGFTATPQWIEHVQKSAVNFGGGSGAFVSAEGLVLTNHHVALSQLSKMSSPEHDYVKDGFFARTRAEEARCPDLELKVLWSIEDVTAKVTAAIDPKATQAQQNDQRKAALARLEQESSRKNPGLKTESVQLYQGGEYWLYRYKTYKDVRLVCAPEEQSAFFGGDPDNFSFPRHDLDFTFFRVYENDQPVRPEHFLTWSRGGVTGGDLVFVVGNPGRTGRMRTMAQLEFERDLDMPTRIAIGEKRLAAYREYARQGPEQARQVVSGVRGVENNLKRQRGFLEVLSDARFAATKQAAEDDLRARVAKDPAMAATYGNAWDNVAGAVKLQRQLGKAQFYREGQRVARVVDIANTLVRMATEVEKPNDQRFREYRESNLGSTRFMLLSPAPVYPAMDEFMFATHLRMALDEMGPDDPWVRTALGGRTPQAAAHDIIAGSTLADVAVRKRLLDGGRKAIEASTDPAIVWARALDPLYREQRKWTEDNIESVESLEGARIARARFALDGKSVYPDATGSLRLAYGKVAGYTQMTTDVPWKTTFFGLYDRSKSFDGRRPFNLPARVAAAEGTLDLSTPLNFVSTNDIIGGNSGSPVVDRKGEYVGLVFDGNIQSFLWDYGYSDDQARCVSVDSRAIIEALRRIYDMGALADEVVGAAK
jgi:hypothetical protein